MHVQEFWEAAAEAAKQRVAVLDPQGLQTLAWAFAVRGRPSTTLFQVREVGCFVLVGTVAWVLLLYRWLSSSTGMFSSDHDWLVSPFITCWLVVAQVARWLALQRGRDGTEPTCSSTVECHSQTCRFSWLQAIAFHAQDKLKTFKPANVSVLVRGSGCCRLDMQHC